MGLGFPSKHKACDKIYRSEAVPIGGATERRATSHETPNIFKNAVSLGWRDDLAVKTEFPALQEDPRVQFLAPMLAGSQFPVASVLGQPMPFSDFLRHLWHVYVWACVHAHINKSKILKDNTGY